MIENPNSTRECTKFYIFCIEKAHWQRKKSSSICIPTSQKLPWDPQCSERAEAAPDDACCAVGQAAVLKDEAKYVNIKSRYDYCLWTEHHYFGWVHRQISSFIYLFIYFM